MNFNFANLLFGFSIGLSLFTIFFYAMYRAMEDLGKNGNFAADYKKRLLKSFLIRMTFIAIAFYIIVKTFGAEGLAGSLIAFILLRKIAITKVQTMMQNQKKK